MKRGEKSGVETAEKQENLGEKLKKIGKRGGHNTPVIPFLRLQNYHHNHNNSSTTTVVVQESEIGETPFHNSSVSARKLAAILWELHHYNIPFSKMHSNNNVVPHSRIRRLQPYHHHRNHLYEDSSRVLEHPDPSPSSPDLPGSAGSLRRHVTASLMQHHRSIERTNHAIQPVSPASYGSSMEIAPYNAAATPTSSIDLKGRIGEASYSLKTSTELLKVLNRIWSLEEQHTSNMSLVKALKKELDHARVRIKDLVRHQQVDRHEIDELMKQITEEKVARKSKEQDRINSAIQSVRDELEDERKLRKRSETLHRRLARELYEVKTSLANALKERDKERKSRQLLEDLCDEFAWGIRHYEEELHSVRQKSDKDWTERTNGDQLILHISEAWLDERMQTKIEPQYGQGDNSSIIEKFRSEIETFLQTKQTGIRNNASLGDPTDRRGSRVSFPLNVPGSAPQDEGDDEDSVSSDSHCFELQKPSAAEETMRPNYILRKPALHERSKGSSVSNLQVEFEEQMARASLPSESRNHLDNQDPGETSEKNQVEISTSKKFEICEVTEESNSSGKKNKADGTPGVNSNYMIDELIRSHYLLSEGGNVPPENDYELASYGTSVRRARASPVRQWTEKLPSHENVSESSTKLPPDLKENTLKAKLLEARTRGQRSRSRLKGTKISF
ncbi:uncharacterized protein At5g41620 [Nicotiana tomentosiformis]|uniref:uncharacterized protein At5g41620 n=1 Tax=Nicotiana tomentosiformis TaxID=4098 RepID=UPI00051B87CD|nr:uncharacterized protein At5g41620 [Nicotiana tomentosiformis]